MNHSADTSALRRQLYALMIVVASGITLGHILSAELLYEPSLHRDEKDTSDRRRQWPAERPRSMPTFSSNDRSRWCTVRALVDEGTFVIGRREYDASGGYHDTGIIFEEGWQSVDKVLHPQRLDRKSVV